MKLKKNMLSIVIVSGLMAGVAYAEEPPPVVVGPIITAGGTVHFTGNLVDSACAVSIDSSDQKVNLGQYRTASFTKTGDTSAEIPFTIVLEECDATVSKNAAVAFSGQRDAANDGLLAVVSNQNKTTAGGVGIQILDAMSHEVALDGTTYTSPQALIDGENTLSFSAHYMSTADKTSAGDADADAVFTMQYN